MEKWYFGEAPLPEVVELAAVLRELTNTVLSLEQSPPELGELTEALRAANDTLAASAPADLTPRIGDHAAAQQRVYVDHGYDVGAYNPCFPEYTLEVEGTGAHGTVEFPIAYEGPPGIVHGGFLAVFFDCVLQQLNCELGLAGKTAELSVRFRRPAPLLTQLVYRAERTFEDDRIVLHAALFRGDDLLCEAHMRAAKGDHDALPTVSPRRP